MQSLKFLLAILSALFTRRRPTPRLRFPCIGVMAWDHETDAPSQLLEKIFVEGLRTAMPGTPVIGITEIFKNSGTSHDLFSGNHRMILWNELPYIEGLVILETHTEVSVSESWLLKRLVQVWTYPSDKQEPHYVDIASHPEVGENAVETLGNKLLGRLVPTITEAQ